MIDDIFLYNISKVFIAIRMEIKHPANATLLELVRAHFINYGLNELFLEGFFELSERENCIWESMALSNSVSARIGIENNFINSFNYILSEAIRLFNERSYDQAYDIIDLFHCLPEILAKDKKINIASFMITRGKYLDKKWDTSYAKILCNLLSVNFLSRMRLLTSNGW